MAGEDSPLYNPEYWELCAAKARIIAHTLHDPEAKAMMATVIDTYEKMAQRAVALRSCGDLPRETILQMRTDD